MIFNFKQFEVKHANSLLKVNTDAVLLGALVHSKKKRNTLLDIGTGCGVIALMLAQKFNNASIDAIEPDWSSYEEAEYNFANAPYCHQLKAYHSALQNFENTKKYDIIVSNPPYFELPDFSKGNNLQGISENRKKFATQFSLTFEELLLHVNHLLDTKGAFWVIIPYLSKKTFIAIGLKNNLHLQEEINIRSTLKNVFIRCVLCFSFDERITIISTSLTLYNSDRTRHTQYTEITKDYYL